MFESGASCQVTACKIAHIQGTMMLRELLKLSNFLFVPSLRRKLISIATDYVKNWTVSSHFLMILCAIELYFQDSD